jgi:hypothetical protein
MAGTVKGWKQALVADPDAIRCDIVIIGKITPGAMLTTPALVWVFHASRALRSFRQAC